MSIQTNAAQEAVQAKPCQKSQIQSLYPTGEQTQTMALIVTHCMLEQLLEALATAPKTPSDSEVDAMNAVEMALQHITKMTEVAPMGYTDFMHGWYVAASVIRGAGALLRHSNSEFAPAMENAVQHFTPLAAAVDFATYAWEQGGRDGE